MTAIDAAVICRFAILRVAGEIPATVPMYKKLNKYPSEAFLLSTTANRGQKWYQSIDKFKISGRLVSFFHFKGTLSQEEHKTILSIFTTIESALTGQIGLIQSSVSAYKLI